MKSGRSPIGVSLFEGDWRIRIKRELGVGYLLESTQHIEYVPRALDFLHKRVGRNSLWVSHIELPYCLNQASLLVLPSFHEGHPKALPEAMTCGLAVIGTEVPGIREVIRHDERGYLCGSSPEEIRSAIQDVLGDADLRVRMGRNAREFVVEHFALERVVEMELALLSEVVSYPPYDSSI